MSKGSLNDNFPTISELNVKQSNTKEGKRSNSVSNLRLETNKNQDYVNHPNFVPESQPRSLIGSAESCDPYSSNLIGQTESCDTRKNLIGESETCDTRKNLIGQTESCDTRKKVNEGHEPKGKPPSGSLTESGGTKGRVFLYR